MQESPPIDRPITVGTAISRGFTNHCPNCGQGRIFTSFLKVTDQCAVCGEELMHHRADDLPAYLVILITGHIVLPLAAVVEIAYSPPYWLHALLWLPLCLILCLGLLQPIKGMVVAVQWFNGMHGFAPAKARRLAALPVAAQPIAAPATLPE